MEPVNVILYDKRDFAYVIKLSIFRWGDDPESSGWALNLLYSYKRQADWQQKSKRVCDRTAGFRVEVGARSQAMRGKQLLNLEKAKKQILFWSFRRNAVSPANILILDIWPEQ